MMLWRSLLGAVLALVVIVPAARVASGPDDVDLYGGWTDLSLAKLPAPTAVRGSSGFFRVARFGDRWAWVDPLDNLWFMKGIQQLGRWGAHDDPTWFKYKYVATANGDGGKASYLLAADWLSQMQRWGFNTVGYGAGVQFKPVYSQAGPPQLVKMPFLRQIAVAQYAAFGGTAASFKPGQTTGNWGLAPAHTLIAGVLDPSVYKGWPGFLVDVYDPAFSMMARVQASDAWGGKREPGHVRPPGVTTPYVLDQPHPALVNEKWMVGVYGDDADFMFGMSTAGSKDPSVVAMDQSVHPHIGWICLAAPPSLAMNAKTGGAASGDVTVYYADPTIHAKKAVVDFLRQRYRGNIAAFNAAWNTGGYYTTFDSDGGWKVGHGLMDENGGKPWFVDFDAAHAYAGQFGPPTGTYARVNQDLNDFLELGFADTYFRVLSSVVRAAMPNHLFLGVNMLNGHKSVSRPEVLRAAGRYLDVVAINLNPTRLDYVTRTYDLVKAATPDGQGRPMISWVASIANPDSPFDKYPWGLARTESYAPHRTLASDVDAASTTIVMVERLAGSPPAPPSAYPATDGRLRLFAAGTGGPKWEDVRYTAYAFDPATKLTTFSGVTRGTDGTTPLPHVKGDHVFIFRNEWKLAAPMTATQSTIPLDEASGVALPTDPPGSGGWLLDIEGETIALGGSVKRPSNVRRGATATAHPKGARALLYEHNLTRVPYGAPTQEEAGQRFFDLITGLLQSRGSDGSHPMVGYDIWQATDNSSERHNWGLWTFRENAYDGRQARRAIGTRQAVTPYGTVVLQTGGEERDHGDRITKITAANALPYAAFESVRPRR